LVFYVILSVMHGHTNIKSYQERFEYCSQT